MRLLYLTSRYLWFQVQKKPSVLQNVERSKLEIFLNPKLFYQKEKKKNGYEN